MLLSFPLEYAIRRVRVNHDGLKLNGSHQLLVYADEVNILRGSVRTLVGGEKKIGLEVNSEET